MIPSTISLYVVASRLRRQHRIIVHWCQELDIPTFGGCISRSDLTRLVEHDRTKPASRFPKPRIPKNPLIPRKEIAQRIKAASRFKEIAGGKEVQEFHILAELC